MYLYMYIYIIKNEYLTKKQGEQQQQQLVVDIDPCDVIATKFNDHFRMDPFRLFIAFSHP